MSTSWEQSRLYKAALDAQNDEHDPQRQTLREALRKFHERTVMLAEHIRADLPNLTQHGASHFDGLWSLAGEIAGPEFQLNPAEAFVFGGAILLHDAGNCLAAHPGGKTEIEQGTEWRDVIAQWGLHDAPPQPGTAQYRAVLLEVLRQLHPQKAQTLAEMRWQAPGDSEPMFLLEHKELRDYYGSLIGEIAASHGSPAHVISRMDKRIVAPCAVLGNVPWKVDMLKLAALLRCADATHLDATRAPEFLYALTQPEGASDLHWHFQSKLGTLSGDPAQGELLFSSSPFKEAESDAWWLCYDTFRMVDNELRTADRLLREHGRPPFAVRAVRGIGDPEQFAEHVRTEGWKPVDTSLRIGNVASLVENFGGAKLYGDKPYLALRELLQNAADAVRALRELDGLEPDGGRIDVELAEQDGATWLHVSDNGIGMGSYVLTEVLLDFGKSLWKSADLRHVWPGLAGSGFSATGQFGIGFFSGFMLGDQVKVTSQPHGGGNEQCQVLEFRDGLRQRALLREPRDDERLKHCGTRVSVCLRDKAALAVGKGMDRERTPIFWALAEIVAALVPALDIAVRSQENKGGWVSCVQPNDWETLPDEELLARIAPLARSENVRLAPIKGGNDRLLGRCGLGRGSGILVVNGIFAGKLAHLSGLLIAENNLNLARSEAHPIAGIREMADWANQVSLSISSDSFNWPHLVKIVLRLAANSEGLPLVSRLDAVFDQAALRKLAQTHEEIWLVRNLSSFEEHSDEDVSPWEFRSGYYPLDHCVESSRSYLGGFLDGNTTWPCPDEYLNPRSIEDVLVSTLEEVWGGAVIEEPDFPQEVGEVNGKSVKREVTIFRRPSPDEA